MPIDAKEMGIVDTWWSRPGSQEVESRLPPCRGGVGELGKRGRGEEGQASAAGRWGQGKSVCVLPAQQFFDRSDSSRRRLGKITVFPNWLKILVTHICSSPDLGVHWEVLSVMLPINQAFQHNRDIYHIVWEDPASARGELNLHHQLSYLDNSISVTDPGGGGRYTQTPVCLLLVTLIGFLLVQKYLT